MQLPHRIKIAGKETKFVEGIINNTRASERKYLSDNLTPVSSPLYGYRFFAHGLSDGCMDNSLLKECKVLTSVLDYSYKFKRDVNNEDVVDSITSSVEDVIINTLLPTALRTHFASQIIELLERAIKRELNDEIMTSLIEVVTYRMTNLNDDVNEHECADEYGDQVLDSFDSCAKQLIDKLTNELPYIAKRKNNFTSMDQRANNQFTT